MHYHLRDPSSIVMSMYFCTNSKRPDDCIDEGLISAEIIQHQLRHVDEALCTGCDDGKNIKLNRSEVSVDANLYHLLSPSDPGTHCSVRTHLACTCCGCQVLGAVGPSTSSPLWMCSAFLMWQFAFTAPASCVVLETVSVANICVRALLVLVMRATFIESLHADCR